jgi:hypothetical protein
LFQIFLAKDLVFQELNAATMVAELVEEVRKRFEGRLVLGGEVVEAAEIGGGAGLVARDRPAEFGAATEELADEGAVKDLREGRFKDTFDARPVAGRLSERIEGVEGFRLDVGDERGFEVAEGLGAVAQGAIGEVGRSP